MLFLSLRDTHVSEVRQQPERITCGRSHPETTSCDRQYAHRHQLQLHHQMLAIYFLFLYHFWLAAGGRNSSARCVCDSASNATTNQRLKLFHCATIYGLTFRVFVYRLTVDGAINKIFWSTDSLCCKEFKAIYYHTNIRWHVVELVNGTNLNWKKSQAFCKEPTNRSLTASRNEKSYHKIHLFKCKRQSHFNCFFLLFFFSYLNVCRMGKEWWKRSKELSFPFWRDIVSMSVRNSFPIFCKSLKENATNECWQDLHTCECIAVISNPMINFPLGKIPEIAYGRDGVTWEFSLASLSLRNHSLNRP